MRGLLLVFLPALLFAQSQTPPPASPKTGQNSVVKSQQSNPATEHAASDPVDSAPAHRDGDNNGTNLPDWIMAAFTIVLAALAGAQFWAMQRQAEYMRLQAEQMR